jgi:hypothetical protein
MWVAPQFIAVALAGGRPGRAALLSAVVFLGAELAAPALGLWEPTGDTTRWLGVAVYVIPAEAALAVSTFYLGALVLAHFVVDVAGWRISG